MEEYNREKTVIELTSQNTQYSFPEFYAQLELPADDLMIYDTLQKLRAVDRDTEVEINVINSPFLPELTDTRIDGASINELNILAEQLELLYREDFNALQKMNALFLYNKESGAYEDGVPMSELINMTFDLDGITCYPFIDDPEELGYMIIDGGIDEKLSELPDEIRNLLDRKAVGLEQMKQDKGIFFEGSYYTTADYEIPKVHTSQPHPDAVYFNLQAAFRLKISGKTKIGKYAGIKREVTLPIDRTEADRLAQECGESRIEDCLVVHAETAIPKIRVQTYKGFEDFARLNAIANAFMSMSEHKRMTFKAVLQRENPRTLDDVIDKARNIDAYELETSAYAETDFYKLYLMYHLESRFDPKWIEPIVADEAEQQLLRQLKAAVTDYGVVSSANAPLYRLVTVTGKDYSKTAKSDKNGEILLPDLVPGLYKVTENPDPRYEAQEPKMVMVEADKTSTVRFKNVLRTGGLRIIKTSDDGVVADIEFTVTGKDYNKTAKSDESGEILLRDLTPGTYTVTEKVDERYEAQAPKTVTVEADKTATVKFKNTLRTGGLKITKTSDDGIVADIEFTVTGKNYIKTAKSDKNGEIHLADLIPGKYTVTEKVDLKYGAVKGLKIDRETEKTIKGAVFGLFGNDETVFSEDTAILLAGSDENGIFTFENVPYGEYLVHEIKPADGYIPNQNNYPVTIKENEEVIEITAVNDRYPEIRTTAMIEGKKEITTDKPVIITDIVSFDDLTIGKEYKLVGVLMDKATGKPYAVDGKEITAEVVFTAEKESGEIEVEFTFNSGVITKDTELVVFETLYRGDNEIAVHADINDKDQTVIIRPVPAVPSVPVIPPVTVSVPKTCDDTSLSLWLSIGAVALGAVISFLIVRFRRKDEDDDE